MNHCNLAPPCWRRSSIRRLSSFIASPIPGMGTVGRSLNYICLFLAGELYFVIPIITIYVGLYVMIKRRWPNGWGYRRTGIVLILLGIMAHQQIDMIQDMFPSGSHTASSIFHQPLENMQSFFADDQTAEAIDSFYSALGGGMLGAIIYGCLFVFFDEFGSQLFVYALLAIGFLYLTGWSYVDMGSKVKTLFRLLGKKSGHQWKEITMQLRRKKQQRRSLAAADLSDVDDDDDEDMIHYPLTGQIDEETYKP